MQSSYGLTAFVCSVTLTTLAWLRVPDTESKGVTRNPMKPGPQINTAAVLGAGTMGARIAAHLANAGVHCFLLDVAPSELAPEEKARGLMLTDPRVRNRVVRAGLEAAQKEIGRAHV